MEKKTCQAANATPIEVCAKASVQKVLKAPKALYFSNADGISFRLSYEGKKGWRLQTSKADNSFDCIGASQEVALFMKEEVKDEAEEITVNKCDCALTVSAADGSYVTLSLSEDFAMNVCTAKGAVVSAIKSIAKNGKNIIVKGALAENEAIYGGGERFDTTNKRGTQMALYSCDGWNNTYTTYVVVPLFLTTQGGGMFFNRNEYAIADFGKENADEWSYSMESEILDCYFWATGKMDDALLGYTLLSGHAYLPAPWMQDVQICRYGPDFWRFDQDLSFATIDEVPDVEALYIKVGDRFVLLSEASTEEKAAADRFFFKDENCTWTHCGNEPGYPIAYGRNPHNGKYYKKGPKYNPRGDSAKTIMQSFMDADMKPSAASMEGRGWAECFDDTDASRENKEDLKKSVEWLHANGLKAMVYIRVGGVRHSNIGFKPEYKVIADVDIKKEDGSIETLENTVRIPWILGTGENPDCGKTRDGSMRTGDYLDITNDEAVEWYFDKIWGEMIDIGIDGVKIDFCECMPDGEKDYGGVVTHYKWKNPDRIVKGTEHHAYPVLFISAFYKRMVELQQAKGNYDGFMVFTRGGGIGSQRNPYMWAGDQVRCFAKLGEQVRSVVNSGLSGVPYMSYDMAGYDYGGHSIFTMSQEKESKIFARAIEFTSFTTNIQTHGDVRHAYEMTEETKQIYRNFTKLHAELLPYMQKYSKIACDTGIPPVRHPVLQYPDDVNVYSLNEEFLLGEGLYVAPITVEDACERELYLPAGNWTNLLTGEKVTGGKKITVKANLGQIPLFLNNDSADAKELAPIFEGANWTAIKNF